MNEWFQAEFHAQRAHQFYEAGQWDKALAELRLALAFDPDQSDWHFGMGLALEALQRFDEAAESFEHVIRLRGPETDALLHLGTDLIRCGRMSGAVEALARVTEIDPKNEPAYCHRIFAYAQMGDHERAEEMFYLARQVVDECPQCFDYMARSLEARGELDRAVWCWQQSLRLDAHYPDVYGNLARVCWRRGQADRAHQFFLQQLREDPGDIGTLLDLGRLLMEMGGNAEAAEKFRRVLELDPTDAAAHQHLGELGLLGGHLDAAAAELEQARRLSPHRPGIHLALAQVAKRRGRMDDCRFHLRTELDHPEHTLAQTLDLAQLLIEMRLPYPAIDLLDPLLSTRNGVTLKSATRTGEARDGVAPAGPPAGPPRPVLAIAWLYRGVAKLITGRIDQGIDDCRHAYRLAPTNLLAAQNLTLAYMAQGRLARARVWLRRAAALGPEDAQVRLLAGRVLRARVGAALGVATQWVGARLRGGVSGGLRLAKTGWRRR